jgi:hypothetical protein
MDFRYVALIALFVVLGLLSTAIFLHKRVVLRSQKALAHLQSAEAALQQLSLDFNPHTAGVDAQPVPSERVTL